MHKKKKRNFNSNQQRDLRIILSNQQRDMRKISFQSAEGPEKDINSIQQRDLRRISIPINRGT
jgi:hypothetical protein